MSKENISFSKFLWNFSIRLGFIILLNIFVYFSWFLINFVFEKYIKTEGGLTYFYQYIPVFITLILGIFLPILLNEFYTFFDAGVSLNRNSSFYFPKHKLTFLIYEIFSVTIVPMMLASFYTYFLSDWIDYKGLKISNEILLQYFAFISLLILVQLIAILFKLKMRNYNNYKKSVFAIYATSYLYYLFPIYIIALTHRPTNLNELIINYAEQFFFATIFVLELVFVILVLTLNISFMANSILKLRYGHDYVVDSWRQKKIILQRSSILTIINFFPIDLIEMSFININDLRNMEKNTRKYFSIYNLNEANNVMVDLLNALPEDGNSSPVLEIKIEYSNEQSFSFYQVLDNGILRQIHDQKRIFEVIYTNQLFHAWSNKIKLNQQPIDNNLAMAIISNIYSGEVTIGKIKDLNDIIISKLSEVIDDLKLVKYIDEEYILFYDKYRIDLNDVVVVIKMNRLKSIKNEIAGFVKYIDPETGILSIRTKDNELIECSITEIKHISVAERDKWYEELIL